MKTMRDRHSQHEKPQRRALASERMARAPQDHHEGPGARRSDPNRRRANVIGTSFGPKRTLPKPRPNRRRMDPISTSLAPKTTRADPNRTHLRTHKSPLRRPQSRACAGPPSRNHDLIGAKRTQFLRFWPENAGPAEKPTQSGSGLAPPEGKCEARNLPRKSRLKMTLRSEAPAGQPGWRCAKRTQFPGFWPENAVLAEEPSQFDCEGRNSTMPARRAAYIEPDDGKCLGESLADAGRRAILALDASPPVNRLAHVHAEHWICRFRPGRRWPIHRISQRRRSCP